MNATELKTYLEERGKLGRTPVTLFLMNAFQMRGVIQNVYSGWITLKDEKDGKEKTVFLHAISTVD